MLNDRYQLENSGAEPHEELFLMMGLLNNTYLRYAN